MSEAVLVQHPDCARHDTGWGHPEHQGRLPAIAEAFLRDWPVLGRCVEERLAEPAGEEDLLRVHSRKQVQRLREAVARAAESGRPLRLDLDTVVSGASWDAALAAAGCAITAVEHVLRGEAQRGFALTRPPGHHATAERSTGFCLVNNVAIAARRALLWPGIERVTIVDWDVHHGNGTQDIFYTEPAVYYLSLHVSPHYPGTGSAAECGSGAGLNTTRNVPLRAGTSAAEYLEHFHGALDAAFQEFSPDLVLVSAGFDCLAADPLGGLLLEPEHLHAMTLAIAQHAGKTAASRVVAVLEGGYVPARLGAGAVAVLRALAGLAPAPAESATD